MKSNKNSTNAEIVALLTECTQYKWGIHCW